MRFRHLGVVLFIALSAGCGGGGGGASTAPLAYTTKLLSSSVALPMQYVPNPVRTDVAYVIEQRGKVRVFLNDVLQTGSALDIGTLLSTGSEAGLLGMTLDPNYATNRYAYLYYTAGSAVDVVVVRYTFNSDHVTINPSSAYPIIKIAEPYANHKGGTAHFGPDGYLYLGIGDGGSGNDPQNNSQTGTTLLGKMLRIDPTGDDFPSDPDNNYSIPSSNPFVSTSGVRGEIWDFGVRNPYRWSFDSVSGAMLLADVGQDAREELNYEPAGRGGRNYGWRVREGFIGTTNAGPTFGTTFTDPIMDYTHSTGESIIGGFVYHGSSLGSSLNGSYLFADYIAKKMWAIKLSVAGNGEGIPIDFSAATEITVPEALSGVNSIDPDVNGQPVFCDLYGGLVARIIPK